MSLLEKLNLTSKTCSLPVKERIAILNAERARIKQITDAFGCPEDDYDDMLAHEIAEDVLAAIEKPCPPGSLHELHGGPAYFWRNFGSKERLVRFLTPFLAADLTNNRAEHGCDQR